MPFLTKPLLFVLSLAGASSAIAVPVSIHVGSKSNRKTDFSSETRNVSVNKCLIIDGKSPITFGDKKFADICGDSSEVASNELAINSLIDSEGVNKKSGTNYSNNSGVSECKSSPPGGEIGSTGSQKEKEKEESLGLCNEVNGIENTMFIKRKEKRGTITFSICSKDCGEDPSNSIENSKPRALQTTRDSNFKELKFYSKN